MLALVYSIGAVCALFSVILSVHLLYQHLSHFSKPDDQRYICRIILMVPIYAMTSWLSMIFPKDRQVMNMIRDCYEAFVIYSFTMLLMNYVGGERKLSINLELKDYINHPWPMNQLFHSFHPGDQFLRLVKVGTLQFVFFRPLLSALVLVLTPLGLYKDLYFGPDNAYLYVFLLNNISFSAALYGLLLFYTATEELLEPFHPLPKFICIKSVIFFSFWQGIVLALLEHFDVIRSSGGLNSEMVSVTVQEFLICIEMLLASIAHRWAFDYWQYKLSEIIKYERGVAAGVKSMLLAEDVIKGVKDSWFPVNYDFELES